jgi:hypothetical protein
LDKSKTKKEKVKSIFLVTARKEGIGRKVYLGNNTKEAVNLIMIGIPKAGSSIAQLSELCTPPHFFR